MAQILSSVTLPGNGTYVVRAAGNLSVTDLTTEIAPTVANGYASPTIENSVTGERVTVNRTGTTDRHRLRILTARWRALESADGRVDMERRDTFIGRRVTPGDRAETGADGERVGRFRLSWCGHHDQLV
jgi:hypothetical protein